MSDAWDINAFPMAFFLLIAAVLNGIYLKWSIGVFRQDKNNVFSRGLLAQGIGEFTWVFPCFVQCFINFAAGDDGEWHQSYSNDGAGCQIMGFYSVFSMVGGMGTTVAMSYLIERKVNQHSLPDAVKFTRIIYCIFALALLYALLPFMGLGDYKYLQVLCYYDWYNDAHAVLILLWSTFALMGGLYFLTKASMTEPKLVIALATYLAGWVLWPPAALTTLSGSDIPDHFMIAGAVLGHAQALLNPVIYGYLIPNIALHGEGGYKLQLQDVTSTPHNNSSEIDSNNNTSHVQDDLEGGVIDDIKTAAASN